MCKALQQTVAKVQLYSSPLRMRMQCVQNLHILPQKMKEWIFLPCKPDDSVDVETETWIWIANCRSTYAWLCLQWKDLGGGSKGEKHFWIITKQKRTQWIFLANFSLGFRLACLLYRVEIVRTFTFSTRGTTEDSKLRRGCKNITKARQYPEIPPCREK